jgi:hypothetical protein
MILDHLERFEPADVSAEHHNTSSMLVRNRQMMLEWLAFLDACEAEARAADPALGDGDVTRIREASTASDTRRPDGGGRSIGRESGTRRCHGSVPSPSTTVSTKPRSDPWGYIYHIAAE